LISDRSPFLGINLTDAVLIYNVHSPFWRVKGIVSQKVGKIRPWDVNLGSNLEQLPVFKFV
jgi:hypothetical protein